MSSSPIQLLPLLHHWLNGRESEWTPGVSDGQGGLACCEFMGWQRVGHDWATELNCIMLMDLFQQMCFFHCPGVSSPPFNSHTTFTSWEMPLKAVERKGTYCSVDCCGTQVFSQHCIYTWRHGKKVWWRMWLRGITSAWRGNRVNIEED